jgi:hypothetical protein
MSERTENGSEEERKKQNNWPAWLALFVSVVLFGINFWCNQIYRETDSRREYLFEAQRSQPILEAIQPPTISGFSFHLRKMNETEVVDRIKQHALMPYENPNVDTSIVQVGLVVSGTLRLINKSPYIANIKLEGYADTLSTVPVIRYKLLSDEDNISALTRIEKADYLKQGDTYSMDFKRELERTDTKEFTLHFIIQYENPSRALFESYFWATYKIKTPPRVGFQLVTKGGTEGVAIMHDNISPDSLFALEYFNGIPYVYTREEAERIHVRFKDIYKSGLP